MVGVIVLRDGVAEVGTGEVASVGEHLERQRVERIGVVLSRREGMRG